MMYYLTNLNRMVTSKTALRVGETLVLQCQEGDEEWTQYKTGDTRKTKMKKIPVTPLTTGDNTDTMFDVRRR